MILRHDGVGTKATEVTGKEKVPMRMTWKIIQKEESRKNDQVFSF